MNFMAQRRLRASQTIGYLRRPASSGIEAGDVPPLIAVRRAGAGLGGVGRDEGGVGQGGPPVDAEADQVLAVRAVAVQQDDQRARRAAGISRNSVANPANGQIT